MTAAGEGKEVDITPFISGVTMPELGKHELQVFTPRLSVDKYGDSIRLDDASNMVVWANLKISGYNDPKWQEFRNLHGYVIVPGRCSGPAPTACARQKIAKVLEDAPAHTGINPLGCCVTMRVAGDCITMYCLGHSGFYVEMKYKEILNALGITETCGPKHKAKSTKRKAKATWKAIARKAKSAKSKTPKRARK